MRRLLAMLVASFALLAGAQSASAAGCNVYNDFNDDGVLQGNYSISCLRTALSNVQGDAGTYTEIIPVIQAKIYAEKRADLLAKQNQSSGSPNRTNSGNSPKPPAGSTSGAKSPSTNRKGSKATTSGTATTASSGAGTTADPSTDSTGSALGATPPVTTDKGLHAAIDNLGPKKATDVPVPVIVIGLVALGLISVGSAGLVMRRRRRGGSFDGSEDAAHLSL
jgi:cobalamin biosynthesis Mg chelatase CobN